MSFLSFHNRRACADNHSCCEIEYMSCLKVAFHTAHLLPLTPTFSATSSSVVPPASEWKCRCLIFIARNSTVMYSLYFTSMHLWSHYCKRRLLWSVLILLLNYEHKYSLVEVSFVGVLCPFSQAIAIGASLRPMTSQHFLTGCSCE